MRLIALTLLLLAGCAGTLTDGIDPGRLILLNTQTIPPESATLRLQYGKPVARNAIQEYDPFCVFEVNTVSDSPQTVRPDTFRVTRIGHAIDTIAGASGLPYPAPIKVGLSNSQRPTHIYYKTLFWLRSEQQPGVRLLTCMSNQNLPGVYPFMRHLSPQEIREALGADFRLEIPPGGATATEGKFLPKSI